MMNRRLTKVALLILIGLLVYFGFFQKPLDILGDLEKIRNSTGAGENEKTLLDYHANMDTLDMILGSKGRKEAIEFLSTLTSKDSKHVGNYYFEKGRLLFYEGNFSNAEVELSNAIEKSGLTHIKALEWRAYCYIQLKNYSLALEDASSILNYDSAFIDKYQRILNIVDSLSAL